jgi:DMSO/TMAO reductase YedYZ heme-binding membrane subunit
MGIVGFYVSATIYASFWARRFIGQKRWRMLHYGSFGAFVLLTAHGLLSGTDAHAPWLVALFVSACVAVFGLTALRAATIPEPADGAASP